MSKVFVGYTTTYCTIKKIDSGWFCWTIMPMSLSCSPFNENLLRIGLKSIAMKSNILFWFIDQYNKTISAMVALIVLLYWSMNHNHILLFIAMDFSLIRNKFPLKGLQDKLICMFVEQILELFVLSYWCEK